MIPDWYRVEQEQTVANITIQAERGIFFPYIHTVFIGFFVYTEYLFCRPSEASTWYCVIPGGYPPQEWQSLPCAGEELDSNPGQPICSQSGALPLNHLSSLVPPLLFFGAFVSVGLVVNEFGRGPAYRVSIYSHMVLHFWGFRAGIQTQDCLTAVRPADLSAMPHLWYGILRVLGI